MTPARALDSVAAALHHPIFDPLELERLRGIVERAGKVVEAGEALERSVEDVREYLDEPPHDWTDSELGNWIRKNWSRDMRPRLAAYRTATTPPADAGKETR